jgi:hypothetical protein
MNPSDPTPEFVVIQLPSEKARAKRVLKKVALAGCATGALMIAAIVAAQRWDAKIPLED